MPTPSIRASAVATANANKIIIAASALSPVNNELMLAFLAYNMLPSDSPVAPSGWSLVNSKTDAQAGLFVYKKVANNESGNYEWDTSSADVLPQTLKIVCINNQADNTPIDVTAGSASNGATATAASITTTAQNSLILVFCAAAITNNTSQITFSMPGSLADQGQQFEAGASQAISSDLGTATQATPGATGTFSVGLSPSAAWSTITIAVDGSLTKATDGKSF